MKKHFIKSLFAFMFVVMSGLVLTACGTQNFDASKIKVGDTTFTYDGSVHVCEIDYEVSGVEVSVTYSEAVDGEFKPADELTYIGAGTYNVYYKLSAVGYNDYVSTQPVEFTVAPKAITVTVSNVELLVGSNPTITPEYTADDAVSNDDLGLTFSIGNKVGTTTAFDKDAAVAGEEYEIVATSTNGNYTISFTDAKVKIINAVEVVGQGGAASTYYSDLATAFAQNTNGASIKLHSELVLPAGIAISNGKEYTLDLNGHSITAPISASSALFKVEGTSKLTIEDTSVDKTGVINSASQANDYSMAVWARNGGTVIINGGTFTNVGAKSVEDDGTTPNNNELIYASGVSSITINGGTFIGNYENTTWRARYTLNHLDGDGSSIVVKGGQYRQYDPDNSLSENPAGEFVPSGFTSTPTEIDGINWYIVTPNAQ